MLSWSISIVHFVRQLFISLRNGVVIVEKPDSSSIIALTSEPFEMWMNFEWLSTTWMSSSYEITYSMKSFKHLNRKLFSVARLYGCQNAFCIHLEHSKGFFNDPLRTCRFYSSKLKLPRLNALECHFEIHWRFSAIFISNLF